MEAIITLDTIRVYAYHGCLKEETIIGSDYLVNLSVHANLNKSSQTDALEDTVDYVLLNKIVTTEMASASKLLEHVTSRIINAVFYNCPRVNVVTVAVSKVNPPIGGDVQMVTIKMTQERKI